jgi:hypothetical protein
MNIMIANCKLFCPYQNVLICQINKFNFPRSPPPTQMSAQQQQGPSQIKVAKRIAKRKRKTFVLRFVLRLSYSWPAAAAAVTRTCDIPPRRSQLSGQNIPKMIERKHFFD